MPTFKETISIPDRPFDRAVEATVTAPEGTSVLNLQELAEKAWRSPSKQVTVGQVTVRVRGFGRR